MKKFKSLIFVLLFTLIIPVYANAEIISHKIYASPTEIIEQEKMSEGSVLKFKVKDEYKLTDDITVENGSVLTVQVKEYVAPKRGKINGHLKIYLDSYTVPSEDNKEIDIKDKNLAGTLKLKTNLDKKEITEMAGVTAAEYAFNATGLSQVYYAAKGLIKPNEGETRLKSIGTNLYNSTGLQYLKKGDDLTINEDSMVEISVKSKASE